MGFIVLVEAATLVPVLAQQLCKTEDIVVPKSPEMIAADLGLVQDVPGQPSLPEWSKIEKLKSFYESFTESNAPCSLEAGNDLTLRLYVDAGSLSAEGLEQPAGLFAADKSFQFYGISRLRVERADQEATRRFALPVGGPARIEEVVKVIEASELGTFLEDLAQLQLVMVPRIVPFPAAKDSEANGEGCFQIANVTVVPTRVFDLPGAKGTAEGLSLDARRRALENVVRQTDWLRRVDTEEPGCGTSDEAGYLDRQITSLNLTQKELIPDMDFLAEAVRFWNDVEDRINVLRAEEQGWKKALKGRESR
jgi:hypothetical protein